MHLAQCSDILHRLVRPRGTKAVGGWDALNEFKERVEELLKAVANQEGRILPPTIRNHTTPQSCRNVICILTRLDSDNWRILRCVGILRQCLTHLEPLALSHVRSVQSRASVSLTWSQYLHVM